VSVGSSNYPIVHLQLNETDVKLDQSSVVVEYCSLANNYV